MRPQIRAFGTPHLETRATRTAVDTSSFRSFCPLPRRSYPPTVTGRHNDGPRRSRAILTIPISPPLSRAELALVGVSLLASSLGCSGLDRQVEVTTRPSTLGRVVVYRNGIAYFERRAQAERGRIRLSVLDGKVNDFLKSLTVTDAGTGKPLPVSFPTQRRRSKGDVQMTIQLPDRTIRDVVLTYISDAPAWKPTYRLMLRPKGKVQVQGWAIVDNTSGEDWRRVRVGVGSSSALSFR